MTETAQASECADAEVTYGHREYARARGCYYVECIGADGKLKWIDLVDNVVCTAGKNLMLDTALAGSAYTVVGPFVGLISSVSYTAVSAADTMALHTGWLEAGSINAPSYSGERKTALWLPSASGVKVLSAPLPFGITGPGTVKGVFMVFGSGAVATRDSTAGTLWSAGIFAGGDKVVINGDVLNVQYSTAL